MKRLLKVVFLAGLSLLFGCDSDIPLDEDALSRKAYNSVEEFLSKDIQDPEVQFLTFPTQLDTIKTPDLFPGKREGYAVIARWTGNNSQGSYFLKEQVFYITPEGKCYQNQDLEKLTQKEKIWLYKNYDLTIYYLR